MIRKTILAALAALAIAPATASAANSLPSKSDTNSIIHMVYDPFVQSLSKKGKVTISRCWNTKPWRYCDVRLKAPGFAMRLRVRVTYNRKTDNYTMWARVVS